MILAIVLFYKLQFKKVKKKSGITAFLIIVILQIDYYLFILIDIVL